MKYDLNKIHSTTIIYTDDILCKSSVTPFWRGRKAKRFVTVLNLKALLECPKRIKNEDRFLPTSLIEKKCITQAKFNKLCNKSVSIFLINVRISCWWLGQKFISYCSSRIFCNRSHDTHDYFECPLEKDGSFNVRTQLVYHPTLFSH